VMARLNLQWADFCLKSWDLLPSQFKRKNQKKETVRLTFICFETTQMRLGVTNSLSLILLKESFYELFLERMKTFANCFMELLKEKQGLFLSHMKWKFKTPSTTLKRHPEKLQEFYRLMTKSKFRTLFQKSKSCTSTSMKSLLKLWKPNLIRIMSFSNSNEALKSLS